jgi:hypothetical protein
LGLIVSKVALLALSTAMTTLTTAITACAPLCAVTADRDEHLTRHIS